MRRDHLAGSLRRLADRAQSAFPEMGAHHHIRDAASALDGGNHAGAQRHLNAAIGMFTPQSVHRHGLGDDDTAHIAARKLMGATHRHLLLVKDVSDQTPHAGRSDGTASGPAEPRPVSGTVLAAGRAHAIELARKAVGL